MEKNLSLFELEEIEKRLKKWIKSDEDFLDEFKTYFLRDGKLSFLISGESVANKVEDTIYEVECTLEDYRDRITGIPLTENQKGHIKLMVDKLEKEKKRLFEINDRKLKLMLGEDFFIPEKNTNKAKGKFSEEELVNFYIRTTIKIKCIPKLKDLINYASSSTWSRKLNDKDFIIKLVHRIQEDKNLKYNFGVDRIEIITELEYHFNAILSELIRRKQKNQNPIRTAEYSDNINPKNRIKKKKNISDDY